MFVPYEKADAGTELATSNKETTPEPPGHPNRKETQETNHKTKRAPPNHRNGTILENENSQRLREAGLCSCVSEGRVVAPHL